MDSTSKPAAGARPGLDRRSAFILIFLVTLLYGGQHTVWKKLALLDAPTITFLRFGTALVPLTPLLLGPLPPRALLWNALEQGFWMFAGFGLSSIGIKYTSATRAAFLLYANTAVVPVLEFLLGRKVERRMWLASGVCFVGCYFLVLDGSHTPLNIGDVYCGMTAITSSMFVIRLSGAATADFAPRVVMAWSLLTVTTLSFVWFVIAAETTPGFLARQVIHWPSVLFLGLAVTDLGTFLQMTAQRVLSAAETSLVLALDSVWAALLASYALGESLSGSGIVGAAMIVGSVLLARKSEATPVESAGAGDGAGLPRIRGEAVGGSGTGGRIGAGGDDNRDV